MLIPFLGTIIYLIVRPPEYLDEARERELELLALEQRLGELGDAEGQQIVGRMLAREGLPAGGDPAACSAPCARRAWRPCDDVRDLDQRLTELEFRLRVADRPRDPRATPSDPPPRTQRPRDRAARELTEPADAATPAAPAAGDDPGVTPGAYD